ncbi:GDSL-like Lipase/Acylhydrolase [Rosistilla carotiformis]|uniref:GDSL-like Lipase/Acylhydrolase n=1 Tax=Rosistilla carotiformis TaxID=2528017 RepID=A0A518JLX7_9BACT|nr:SGNH/GDSL hydrolase family protein [Rosistilla carotiformis]QDV66555.1 GDSL-like Lipase/Acylhydrolase [Rosistilla carotiformis]
MSLRNIALSVFCVLLFGLDAAADQPQTPTLEPVASVGVAIPAPPFDDGERVCFLGDSITAGGYVQTLIADYYLTRFPERTIHFFNAGRSGDTASGSLSRLKEDVIDKRPTSVVIMFGMNDVSRGSYTANPTDAQKVRQQQALDRYKAKMKEVVARLRDEANNPKLYFMTPSPFDQTVVLDRDNNQPGCNDGLGRCAEIVRQLALENNAPVIDLHGPMTAINLQQQKRDPTWTIVGPDRVHPGSPGRLMMAWLLLKAQGVPATISRTTIDAAAGAVTESVNADVTSVERSETGVKFVSREEALPFPINAGPMELLDLLPIGDDLAQQILSVTGLSKGTYELRIDGAAAGQYKAEELGGGINLAFNKATPQYKQAQRVAEWNSQRRSAEASACSLLNTRRWMQSYYKVDVDDPQAVQAHYDHFEDKKQYSAVMARKYLEDWPKYSEFRKRAAELQQTAETSRESVPHTFELVRISG